VFVARNGDGLAVGVGALKDIGTYQGRHLGEIKRMFTDPAVRGQRIGVSLLDAIETRAKTHSVSSGSCLKPALARDLRAAVRLYQNHGFTECGVVLDYPESDYSRFFEKKLSA
jgi:putative acetyltransferase